MRISDWSSDVCSSDLRVPRPRIVQKARRPMSVPLFRSNDDWTDCMRLYAAAGARVNFWVSGRAVSRVPMRASDGSAFARQAEDFGRIVERREAGYGALRWNPSLEAAEVLTLRTYRHPPLVHPADIGA